LKNEQQDNASATTAID